MATQQFIDNLILIIENAEDPESVTNEMVAAVLDHLNAGYKDLLANNAALATEKAERQAADDAIQSTVAAIQLALQTVTARVNANTDTINTVLGKNATTAIENFNEILDFLEGVKDSDSLVNLFDEIRQQLDAIGGDISDLQSTMLTKADFKRVNTLEKKVSGINIYPFDGISDPFVLNAPTSGVWWKPAIKGINGIGGTTEGFLFCSSPYGFTEDDYNDENGSPHTDRLYRLGGSLYHIVDGELRELGSADLALGHTDQTAYPGNEGAELKAVVITLQTTVATVAEQLQKQQEQIDVFRECFSTFSLGRWENLLDWNNDNTWENGSGCQCSGSGLTPDQIYDPLTQSLRLDTVIARYDAPTESIHI